MKKMYQKREEAEKRNETWASLSTKQKLATLYDRPGSCDRQIRKLLEKKNGKS